MYLKQFYERIKLPFELLPPSLSTLPPFPFFDDATSQRAPNVPSAFFSTEHR
jgi:hypothetical protein